MEKTKIITVIDKNGKERKLTLFIKDWKTNSCKDMCKFFLLCDNRLECPDSGQSLNYTTLEDWCCDLEELYPIDHKDLGFSNQDNVRYALDNLINEYPELYLKNNRPRLINPSNSYNCNN